MAKKPQNQVSCHPDVNDVLEGWDYIKLAQNSSVPNATKSKYKAKKTEYDGIIYDSVLEASVARRLDELMAIGDVGEDRILNGWMRQIPFELIPKHGSERAIVYKADFFVMMLQNLERTEFIIEVKGYDTAVWRLKRRLFLHLYPGVDLQVVRSVADVDRVIVEGWHGR